MIAKKIFWAVLCLVLIFGGRAFAAEGRIEIDDARNCSAGAGTITTPGSYFLSHDIDNLDSSSGSCVNGDAIIIDSDHVTIDLGGHTITVNGGFSGIVNANNHSDIEIKNGKIVTTGGSSGINFTAPTGEFRIYGITAINFTTGINLNPPAACADPRPRAVITGSSTVGGATGINFNCGQSSRVEENQVRGATNGIILVGVVDSIVDKNIANQNTSGGIVIDNCNNLEITNNVVTKNNNVGLLLKNSNTNIVSRNDCSFNLGHGIHLDGALTGTKGNMVTYNNASNNGNPNPNNGIFVDTGASQNSLDWNVTSNNFGCGIQFTANLNVKDNIYSYNRSKGNAGLPAPGAYCDPNVVGQNIDFTQYVTQPGNVKVSSNQ